MEIIQDIDFGKYNTFFLEYYKFENNSYQKHLVRPSTATYEEITNDKTNRVYTLEAVVASFDSGESMPQILCECSILGISIDFIDILVPEKSITSWNDHKIFQIIDMHKDDVTKYIDSIDAPRFYIALNRRKKDVLKFLVVDRISQDPKIKFLNGEYDANAVRSGFSLQQEAYAMCKKLNEENRK